MLELPFGPGERWSLTGGPHLAWNAGTPRGTLDFSPITNEEPCTVSARWVTAPASGTIVHAADNAGAIDLDGDGHKSTGWVFVYYTWPKTNSSSGRSSRDGVSVGASLVRGRPLDGEARAPGSQVQRRVVGGGRSRADGARRLAGRRR